MSGEYSTRAARPLPMEKEQVETWRGLTADGSQSPLMGEEATEVALEKALVQLALAEERYRETVRSTSWRLTAPLRKVAAGVPQAWRSHLRQAARVAWWVATPWKLPHRLRWLRERRENTAPRVPLVGAVDAAYDRWIHDVEPWNPLLADDSTAARLSFVMHASGDWDAMERTIRSFEPQTFARWQLVLAAGPALPQDLRARLSQACESEARLSLLNVDEDRPLAGLREAMAVATGEYVAILEAGDMLAPRALNEIAWRATRVQDPDILYSDDDELGESGARARPQLKPGWSPELLETYNYFGRLTLLRSSLVRAVGGLDPTLGAGAEWDLNLRVSARASTIQRIPRVLCHRHPGSHRDRPREDTPAAAELRETLRLHWKARGHEAKVRTMDDGTLHATWSIDPAPLVSVIIPTKDKVDLLRMCLQGLLQETDYPNFEIVIVDTGSREPATAAFYESLGDEPRVAIVHFERKFNYSMACNHGARHARGELLLFLNNDIEIISRDWLAEMVRFARRPGVGVVGTQLVYPSRELQHGGVGIGVHLCGLMYRGAEALEWGVFGSPHHARNWMAIMGACQMVSREAFDRVGGFDESYMIAMSDVALCLRAWKAGFRTVYAPQARLVHHEGATRGNANPTIDVRRIADDIRELGIDEDPYLHPSLDGNAAIPALPGAGEPTVRETLKADLRSFGSPVLGATLLPLDNDGACVRAAQLPREQILWAPQPGHGVHDAIAAARWCIDLLRGHGSLRERFPRALSDGATGDFARWLEAGGAREHGLPDSARPWLAQMWSTDFCARARQAFLFHGEMRELLPIGLLPQGRFEAFHWFMRHARRAHDLRLEEIWWLLITAAEQPERELVNAYDFTPAWQTAYPDGLTVFGRDDFAAWLRATYRTDAGWTDPEHWPVTLPAARQLRLAYLARDEWRSRFPEALRDRDQALALIEWLRGGNGSLSASVRAWCAGIDAQAAAAALSQPGVNLIGHFAYPSGLRVSVESIVEGLRRNAVGCALRDLRTDRRDDPIHERFRDFEEYDITVIHAQPEPFFDVAYDRSDVAERLPRTYRIAYWYWEFDTIPDSWIAHARQVDEVWTATEFVAKGLREKLDVPVRVLFPGVQLAPYERRPRSHFGLAEAPYTFLFTFHMMSIMERKNPVGLIRAFRQAFGNDMGVQLVLKTSFGERHPAAFAELLREVGQASNIRLIDAVYSPDEVLSLMDACDAYVSLHRSEGLGLTMAEAMLMGKPVIATGFSGNVDFMDESNSVLVGHSLVQLGRDIPPYSADYHWAEPSIDEAAQWMRKVYDDQAWARQLGEAARRDAQQRLSLDAAGRRIVQRLEEIRAQRTGRAG